MVSRTEKPWKGVVESDTFKEPGLGVAGFLLDGLGFRGLGFRAACVA